MATRSMAHGDVCDPLAERFQSEIVEDLKEAARRKQALNERETWANAIRLDRLRNLWRKSQSPRSVA